jgi:hypothetical protein
VICSFLDSRSSVVSTSSECSCFGCDSMTSLALAICTSSRIDFSGGFVVFFDVEAWDFERELLGVDFDPFPYAAVAAGPEVGPFPFAFFPFDVVMVAM